jgi:DNA-binding SARP family transcriptional activator
MGEFGVLGFHVLGPVQMSIDGTAVSLGTTKPRVLLAMLIINRNRPVAVESLITAAWEDSPPPKPNVSVHTYISELRRVVKQSGRDPKEVLARAAPGYRLGIAEQQCDIGRFQAGQAAGVKALAAGRFQEAARLLGAALAQWKGPVLADLRDYEFARVFAVAVDRDRLTTAAAWAEAEIACGRADAVLDELDELTTEHPYEEPVWAQLITALYVTERQADALAACRRLRAILVDDLGIDPGPRICDLEELILRQQPLDIEHVATSDALDTLTLISQSSSGSVRPLTPLLRDSMTGESHRLSGLSRIGRDRDNDIVLVDRDVSRRHGAIVDTGASYLIVDTHSRNGIQLDGVRVKTSAALTDGAHIGIGDHQFVFEIRAAQEVRV